MDLAQHNSNPLLTGMVKGFGLGSVFLLTLFLALTLVGMDYLGMALIGGTVLGLSLVLHRPMWVFYAWLLLGPTMGSWADVRAVSWLPALTPDRLALALVAVAFIIGTLIHRRALKAFSGIEIAMLAFVVMALVSCIAHGGTYHTHSEGGLKNDVIFLMLGYAVPFFAYFLSKNLLHSNDQIRKLMLTFSLVGGVVSVFGLAQSLFGFDFFSSVSRFETIHQDRATGSLSSAVEFGMVVNTGLVAAVLLLGRCRGLTWNLLQALTVILCLLAIYYSKTRAIWLALVIDCAVLAIFAPRFRGPVLVLAILGILVACGTAPWWLESDIVQNRIFALDPIYNRVAATATALNMFIHQPVFGFGFGRFTFLTHKWSYIVSFGNVPPTYAYEIGVPHNEFLHVLIWLGLSGMALYVYLLVSLWRGTSKTLRASRGVNAAGRDVCLLGLAVFLAYLTCGLFSDLFFSSHASTQVYVLLGAAAAVRHRLPALSREAQSP